MDTNNPQPDKIKFYVQNFFDNNVLPNLIEYIKIPNQSRDYDPEIMTNGLQEKAAELIFNWAKAQNLKNLSTAEIIHEKGKTTPTLLFIIEGTSKNNGTALVYGHFDKQPPMFDGWKEGTGPFSPKIIGDKLYGRGGADDGYSTFGAISIIKACQENGLEHPRMVIIIEGDEESQGEDIPKVLASKKELIGNVDLVFVLDSGAWSYDTLWVTSTLKGVIEIKLTIQVLDEGVHSGSASGVVPSSFRILRQILDRIDSVENGEVNSIFQSDVPPYIYEQYKSCIDVVGKEKVIDCFPWFEKMQPTTDNPFQAYLNKAWRPQLSVTGMDGIPPTQIAGNVLRPQTQVKLSMRLPPNMDSKQAAKNLLDLVTKDPPYKSKVTADLIYAGNGFYVRETADFLKKSLRSTSMNFFGKQEQYLGEGGSIPIVDLFYEYYPKAQFIITGVLGPFSNAHGPNESLDLPYTKKVLCCMTQICSEMAQHFKNVSQK